MTLNKQKHVDSVPNSPPLEGQGEASLYPLAGIVTVLNTPFNPDDSINFQALKNNVRDALKAGVAGFLVPAMASEVYKLSETERIKMVIAVL